MFAEDRALVTGVLGVLGVWVTMSSVRKARGARLRKDPPVVPAQYQPALGPTCQRNRNMALPLVSRGNGRLPLAQTPACTRRGELVLEKQPGDKWRTLNLVGRVFRLCRLA